MAPQPGVSPIQELRIQAQWRDLEKKQMKIRLKWFLKNYEKVYLNPPEKLVFSSGTKEKAAELKKMRAIRFQNDREVRRKFQKKIEALPPYKPSEWIGWKGVQERPLMRPVPQEIRDTLYDGISHNDEGRKKYLTLRNKQDLEDKFYEPITYQHEYGWHVAQRAIPCIRYGKQSVIKSSFNQRNGALKKDSPFSREPMNNCPPSYLT